MDQRIKGKKTGRPLNEQHPICPTGFGLTNGAFLYVEKNERRIADNETDFYSARCFARESRGLMPYTFLNAREK